MMALGSGLPPLFDSFEMASSVQSILLQISIFVAVRPTFLLLKFLILVGYDMFFSTVPPKIFGRFSSSPLCLELQADQVHCTAPAESAGATSVDRPAAERICGLEHPDFAAPQWAFLDEPKNFRC